MPWPTSVVGYGFYFGTDMPDVLRLQARVGIAQPAAYGPEDLPSRRACWRFGQWGNKAPAGKSLPNCTPFLFEHVDDAC